MQVKIARKFAVATDICAFELVRPDGGALPAFSAGAHIDVVLRDGLVRQYSLCNDPRESHRYLIAVLRDADSRGGSVAMHALEEGGLLEVGEPKNHFPLHAQARHSLLLAGGIGVTPIISMAEALDRDGASFEMHYCTRSAARTAFRDRLAEPRFSDRVHLYFDDAGDGERLRLDVLLAQVRADTHLYVCGPSGFIAAAMDAAKAAGWDDANVHREFFAATPTQEGGGAFQVKLSSTGKVIDVAPGVTVVAALAQAGIDVPTSCEQGVCGTCLTRVLSGEPDHRDVYLMDEEKAANDQFLPCCSRSKSPMLVLDL
ncbi:PDR/VanB family oxidoreductase [Trinickia dinghuensis]|uniref:Oxidoreductase n=1 Tax=Trinickia dinghuensis TaxID=2291023 RepID=A0A3D8K0I1_9BURK|nr:PDR/VanB family oxidoreductase [Trinickia dinghuensis]RDU98798.1 oxidoreductase [Trinickia dinghuensis]